MVLLRFADEHCKRVEAAGGKGASLARMAAPGTAGAARLRRRVPTPSARRCPTPARSCSGPRARIAPGRRSWSKAIGAPGRAARRRGGGLRRAGRGRAAGGGALERVRRGLRGGELRRPAGDLPARARRATRCWSASATAGPPSSRERALFYREQKGSLDDLGMAVVVQRMVSADVAGVLFTIDPVQRRRDRMVVEAVFGLGEAVVSGQVTPDHFMLARDGTLKRERLARAAARGGERARRRDARARARAEEGGRRRWMTDELRRAGRARRASSRSASAGRRTSSGRIEDGELYVLQCRPVTA